MNGKTLSGDLKMNEDHNAEEGKPTSPRIGSREHLK
jgi:hypothetical protein